ncbi:MAG: hypothetical protein IKV92_08370 [Akkermansia sp.]|nr:hypothetical protein [Akkermansia sp.]
MKLNIFFLFFSMLFNACSLNNQNIKTTSNNPNGRVVLYDTNYLNQYIGTLDIALKQVGNDVYSPSRCYRLKGTGLVYRWEEPEIKYASSESIEYELQILLCIYMIPLEISIEDIAPDSFNYKRYKSVVRFKKFKGNNTLVPEIVHDALKNEQIREIDLFGKESLFQMDFDLELRKQ